MKKLRTLNGRPVNSGRLFLACIIMLASNQLLGQSICFNSHNDFVFGGASNAQCIDFGDFDNDGVKDVLEGVFTSGPSLKMAFIKGNSNGTFQTPVFFEVGNRPLDVKTFDFNQDGNLDAVIANQLDATISVVFGNGDGTFSLPVTYPTGVTPNDIALGDYNEDGFMDLAVSCLAGNVNIFLMDAGSPGTFIPSGTAATGSGPRGIVTKDFNNDGHLDLATSNNSAGGFGVVYGTGTGTFGAATAYPTQTGAYHIISGDFNGDNLPDIAVSNETSNSVSVSINTGSSFLASTHYPVKAKPNGIKVGDFNGDNILDIATVEYEDNVFTTLQGTGIGTFLPAQHLICIGAPRDLVIYDCNNDGFNDAVISTNVGQVTVLFLGEGDGTFQHRTSYPVGTNPQGISKADFNNDGFQDIVVANTIDNTVQLLLNDGTGEFTNGGIFATDLGPMSVDAKDVNGDGNMDVVTANNTNNTITVLLGNGAGSLASAGNFNCNAQPKIVKLGDVNNDGFQDAVVLNATNTFNVLLGTGSGTFGAPTSYPGANNGTDLELGLMFGDAFLDVVMTAGGNNKIVVSLNSGTGTFNPITEFNAGTNPKGLALGDLNNDGRLDAVTANYGSNHFTRFFGNAIGGFSPATVTFTGTDTGPMDVELVDLNNDGNLDVIGICEVSTASTGYAPVFTGNGAGAFTFYNRFSTDMSPHRMVVADWNNDGMKDAAVVNRLSKTVSILKNTTAFITADGPLTFCEGAGTTLSVTPATTYLWSAGQTIPVIAPVTSGTYTAQTWTGHSSWCTSTSNAIIVDVSPSPTLTLSNDVSICAGQSTTLTVSGADSYLWAGGLGTLTSVTVSPMATQYYVVEGFGLNGCARKDSILVTVVGAPDATFTTLNATYCQDAAQVTLVPGTLGGTFSGGGVSGSTFNPSSAPLGSNTITYFIDLGGGCSNTSSQTVTVSAAPIATFSGLATNYCASAADATLSPAQGGGTFSGTGISGNQFSPTTAGVGTFLITYSITTGGCSNSSAISTTVNPIPNAAFSGLVANYCSTEGIVILTPSVAGGTFSGTGVVGSTFDPASAILGANTVTYTITNGFGCTNQTSFVTNVATQPDANFSGLAASYCESSSTPIALTPIVGGGTFSGPGISGANFIPSNANLGTNTITYTVSLGSCSSTTTLQTIVHALPNANFSGLNGTYCVNDAASTLVPGTSGGIFSGTGVTGNSFDPATASLGSNTVTYALTDGNGCSNSSALVTNVIAGPSPNFTGLAVDYCLNDASVTLTPTTGGGAFSGPGITGASFNPSTANLGLNTITYQVTGGGCTNTFSLQTTVHTIPTATFTGLDATYCSADAISTLVPTQAGGTFTGSGVVGSTFNPATATIGSNVITYSISDGFGCSNLSTISTVVTESFDATFTGLAVDYCESQTAPVNLVPVTSGGTFTGSGISGTQFTPSTATLGLNTINYEVVNGACISNYAVQTTVHVTPTATFTGLDATYCSADAISTLVPTQAGGTFTGSGIVGSTFNPATATIGSNVITYSISDGFGCSNLSTISTVVTESFDATFTGLAVDYCESQTSPVNLVPVTSGGTFTGSGISGTQFTPSTATLGLNTINYEVVNGGCISNYAVQTTVHVTPTATFTGLDATYCSADAISTLVPTQAGGTFTGSGIVGSTFNPATATIGSNVITYSISDGFGCSNLSTISTVVTESFDATFTGLAVDYCESQTSPVNLVPVTSGGTFTGSGISGTQFTPSTATLGLNTINYEVVNGGCISNYAVQTTVHVTPTATFTGLDATYCSADAISTLVPTQAGGTFTGSGIVGSTFNPATATIGSNVITYSISDGFGCSNLSTISTVVTESFDATFTGLAVDYCESQTSPVNLVPVTSGGTFTGSGISGTQFTPSTATLGLNTINYEVVNGGCISNYAVQTTVHVTPTATFTGLDATYCSADPVDALVPTVLGGSFSGGGIVGFNFQPNTAAIGTNFIAYTLIDGFGCTGTSIQSTVVTESLDPSFSGLLTEYCSNETAPVTLVPVTSGGTFTGSGISGTQFTPSTATLGLNTINYEVVNGACISNYAVQTTVHVTPTATFTGLDATYCSADPVDALVPTVLGGSFSGGGIVGFNFQPNTAAIGTNFIAYTLIDGFGCTGTSIQSTVVTESLDPSFSGLLTEYCSNETAPVTLVPVTSGGTFTGNGISGMQFTPSNASLGANTINYQLINAGCISNASFVTTINSVPDASFTGLTTNYCNANQDFTLTPLVSGGIFSGPGMTGNIFNPYFAGTGNFVITYTVDDVSGCSGVSSQNISVYTSPDASFTGLDAHYCIYDVPATLIPAETGGVFSGPGVVGNQFFPATASIGLFNVTYDISNANCTSTYTFATTVHDTPTVTYTGLDASYCSGDVGSTLVPTPLGGIFSGAGMTGNQFSPAGLTGNYTIEYEYTDAFGCSAIASHNTEVFATEDPFFTGIDALHCSSDGLVTLVPTTSGGVFSGNGVVGSTFDPGLASLGVNNIQYQIGSGSCIGTYQFSTIILAAPNVVVNTNSNSLSVNLEFGTTYQWINCADMQPIIGANNFNFVPPFEGSFAVVASNANCTDTSVCSNFFLGLKDLSSIEMSYYPNPSSGNLTIELEETAELEIIDMSGRVIAREHLMNGKNILELSHISRGMYQLYLTTEKGLRGSYPFVKN